jgi:hypothetical protein
MKWLGLLLLIPATAYSQATPENDFANIIQDISHHQAVLDAAQQTPVWTHIACGSASFNEAPEIAVYSPVRFDPSGEPVAGEWREGIVATGCGPAITLNVLTKVTATATLATGPLLPGGTIADPSLQNAAQAPALSAAGGIPAGCADAYIADTAFVAYETAVTETKNAPWREIWSIRLCGATRKVIMHFLPTWQGVTVSANPG